MVVSHKSLNMLRHCPYVRLYTPKKKNVSFGIMFDRRRTADPEQGLFTITFEIEIIFPTHGFSADYIVYKGDLQCYDDHGNLNRTGLLTISFIGIQFQLNSCACRRALYILIC